MSIEVTSGSERSVLVASLWFPQRVRQKPGPHQAEIDLGLIVCISITRFHGRISHFSAQSLRQAQSKFMPLDFRTVVTIFQWLCDLSPLNPSKFRPIERDENENVRFSIDNAQAPMTCDKLPKLMHRRRINVPNSIPWRRAAFRHG